MDSEETAGCPTPRQPAGCCRFWEEWAEEGLASRGPLLCCNLQNILLMVSFPLCEGFTDYVWTAAPVQFLAQGWSLQILGTLYLIAFAVRALLCNTITSVFGVWSAALQFIIAAAVSVVMAADSTSLAACVAGILVSAAPSGVEVQEACTYMRFHENDDRLLQAQLISNTMLALGCAFSSLLGGALPWEALCILQLVAMLNMLFGVSPLYIIDFILWRKGRSQTQRPSSSSLMSTTMFFGKSEGVKEGTMSASTSLTSAFVAARRKPKRLGAVRFGHAFQAPKPTTSSWPSFQLPGGIWMLSLARFAGTYTDGTLLAVCVPFFLNKFQLSPAWAGTIETFGDFLSVIALALITTTPVLGCMPNLKIFRAPWSIAFLLFLMVLLNLGLLSDYLGIAVTCTILMASCYGFQHQATVSMLCMYAKNESDFVKFEWLISCTHDLGLPLGGCVALQLHETFGNAAPFLASIVLDVLVLLLYSAFFARQIGCAFLAETLEEEARRSAFATSELSVADNSRDVEAMHPGFAEQLGHGSSDFEPAAPLASEGDVPVEAPHQEQGQLEAYDQKGPDSDALGEEQQELSRRRLQPLFPLAFLAQHEATSEGVRPGIIRAMPCLHPGLDPDEGDEGLQPQRIGATLIKPSCWPRQLAVCSDGCCRASG